MLAAATAGPPGFRRATLSLAVFYGIYIVCWQTTTDERRRSPGAWLPKAQVALLALLLVHHAMAFLPNARSLAGDVPVEERHWLRVAPTPALSVASLAEAVATGHSLDCRTVGLGPDKCRYAEVYAAVEGYLRWSRGQAIPQVHGYDFGSGQYVPLAPETWPFGSQR